MQADVILLVLIFKLHPGALKNVFDLLPVNAFRDKVIGLCSDNLSSIKHYLIPEMHLKPILSYMKAHTMQTYVFIEERFSNQQIVNDDVVFRLKALAQSTMRTAKSTTTSV